MPQDLCIEFVNADVVLDRVKPDSEASYADLVGWSLRSGLIPGMVASQLQREAQKRPGQAREVFDRAVQWRQAFHGVLSASIRRKRPPEAALAILNEAIAAAAAHRRLDFAPSGFAWTWDGDSDFLEQLLWPIVGAAAELLTSTRLRFVRECAAVGCGRLFLDSTKNHSRRWCDMKRCGNRAKVRRLRARRRNAG